jgi:hypothetical protein
LPACRLAGLIRPFVTMPAELLRSCPDRPYIDDLTKKGAGYRLVETLLKCGRAGYNKPGLVSAC